MTPLPRATSDDTPVLIPTDGQEHQCPCGFGGLSVWDCDGWRSPVVVDDEGRRVWACPRCDREVAVGP